MQGGSSGKLGLVDRCVLGWDTRPPLLFRHRDNKSTDSTTGGTEGYGARTEEWRPRAPFVPAVAGGSPVPVLFAVTLFLSAVLLFAVEPMFARMVLPRLGGAPA